MQNDNLNLSSQGAEFWYYLDATKLLPGDVILERGTSINSNIIRTFDKGFYSHAILYIGNGQIAEAVGDGVVFMPTLRVITSQPSNFGVYRLPRNELNYNHIEFLESAARQRAFSYYDTSGALATKIPYLESRDDRQFCSRFVTECYDSAGITLVPGKTPDKVTPNDLAREPSRLVLIEGVEHFSRYITSSPEEMKDLAELADRHNALQSSFLAKNRAIEQEAFDKFSPTMIHILSKINPEIKVCNLGQIKNILADPNFPYGDIVSDNLTTWLEEQSYFDLLPPAINATIERLYQAVQSENRSYIETLMTRLPHFRHTVIRFQKEVDAINGLPNPRSVHLRMREMHEKNIELMQLQCDLIEKISHIYGC
jgi:hypothetical protein